MSLGQLKAFLACMQADPALRLSGQKVGHVTVTKQDIPDEYN
jgi:hypothetical protein